MLVYVILYLRCTNLFVYFVVIYISLCATADDRTSSFCCIYIGGRSMICDDVKLYVWDGYVIEKQIFIFWNCIFVNIHAFYIYDASRYILHEFVLINWELSVDVACLWKNDDDLCMFGNKEVGRNWGFSRSVNFLTGKFWFIKNAAVMLPKIL